MNDANAQCPEELTRLSVSEPKTKAVGMPAVLSSLKHVWGTAGIVRGTKALRVLNQMGGVDCPSCAWPDPVEHRSMGEFCENGAKAVAWEADTRTMTAERFRQTSIDELGKLSDYEHGQLGRLVEPMVLRPGLRHYEPISWDDAFSLIANELKALASPDEAIFYTSGRTSNEAAFLYQLFVRQFGTNNLPDCSNMCHESSGSALTSTIGIGKGTVTLADFEKTELILILGQNPGTNHPRMLTALQQAKRAGAKIVAINPLKEAGLLAYRNPQEFGGLTGLSHTQLADDYFQVRIGGDQALLQGIMKCIVERGQIDQSFIKEQTTGFDELSTHLITLEWKLLEQQSGIPRTRIESLADRIGKAKAIISCWAMGLTQHKHAVATIRDLVNLTLLRGSIGKPGAGLCPVRGHSNVQGDRTMGIYERPPAWTAKLGERFGFTPPSKAGFDTVEAIRAMRDGRGKVFFALGGNFLSATPDTSVTAAALANCSLTVHVSIKLNRSHLVPGKTALILPCLGRTEQDRQATGEQFVTTENSMGVVQSSKGTLSPASSQLLSEPAIVCRLAHAVFGNASNVPWKKFEENYDLIREAIEAVVPGFEKYNERVRRPGGFDLPNGPRFGTFSTPDGKARFTVTEPTAPTLEPGQLAMMTIRTHDQFNTTVYGLNDRYRGITGERRVVLMNADDLRERGLKAGDVVDLVGHFRGETRRANRFLTVSYDIPKGNCATYFPETNVLVPLDSTADESQTPTSKMVAITIEALRPL
jgi:molybdopterin-dependent oxidoreductase alpha subunit